MKKQGLRQVLHELASQAVPSDRDVWPMLRKHLAVHPHRSFQKRLIPATSLGLLVFALAIMLVFSITAYATGPWISHLFERDERLQHIDLSMKQPINLSQTIENVTITVEWAYSDTDLVLVGYNIRTSDEKRFDPTNEMLTDRTGITFPWQGTYGVTGQSDIKQVEFPTGEGTFIGIFDNISASRTLQVHFEVHAQELVMNPTEATPSTKENSETTVVLTPVPVGRIIGPFTFDFIVPVSSSNKPR